MSHLPEAGSGSCGGTHTKEEGNIVFDQQKLDVKWDYETHLKNAFIVFFGRFVRVWI
jgi:hypothetical protein